MTNKYYNESKKHMIEIAKNLNVFMNHPESSIYSVIENCINNMNFFDILLKKISYCIKKMCIFNTDIRILILVSRNLTSLNNIINTNYEIFVKIYRLQYNKIDVNMMLYNRHTIEQLIDYFEYVISFIKEIQLNLLRKILKK